MVGHLHQLLRHPGKIRFEEIQAGERIAHVGVEAGRDDDEIGRKPFEPRQDHALHRFAELVAAVARAERRVDDGVLRATFTHRAGARIKRHLVRRAVHHPRMVPVNVLAAVAMVHVEIHDRDALGVVRLLRMARRDGGIVEQAETHRRRGLGVMAGRAGRDECVRGFASHHLVDRERGAAGSPHHRLERARRHCGVAVDPHHALFRRGIADVLDVIHRVCERDHLDRRHRRLVAHQSLKLLVLQRALDRAQPVRPLGMTLRREVVETGRMAQQQCGHAVRFWFAAI